jgi:hypothetical protein
MWGGIEGRRARLVARHHLAGTATVFLSVLARCPSASVTAALLPALDPTPMGWKERDWYLPADTRPLFDRNGNIGPTIWWGGEVIGGWAVRTDGEIATSLLLDRGAAAARAVRDAADTLRPRLEGTPVVPSFPTPLETELRTT